MGEFKSFYKDNNERANNTWCKYTKRLDTYGKGCSHDCSYCYAKSLLDFRGLWDPKDPSVADIEKIRKKVASFEKGTIVRLGGMTDCFQPIELKYRNTYNTIKILNEYGIGYLIVTKSDIIAYDEYIEILDKELAHIQITITNTDDNKSLEYEKATVPSKRIKAIEKLSSLGYDVAVRLSPYIESYVDTNIINSIKCDKILIEFLKVNPWVKKWFNIDYSEYSLKCVGYEHLQLDKKIELVNKITGFKELTVGEYVPEHYEYFRDNVNYNKNDCCNLRINNGGQIMDIKSPNIYIYDIEVFSDDWIVDFSRPELDAPHITIHNDNARLRAFLDQPDIIIGGFNNKHYDDYVVETMLLGGSNIEVKRHNDFIIKERRNPWEFPFIQFKKKPFKSFDLRDDIPDDGISLKAIEGNLKLPIVESSVPFDIDRKLTPEELEEVIKYCRIDVNATKRLYWERKKNYLDAKVLAGSIYGISEVDALGYTNAKLSSIALEANYTERTDERDYKVPDNLPQDKIPKIILDFFLQITDKSIPDAKLFGAGKGSKGMSLDLILKTGGGESPVTYSWGGFHGAPPCIVVESTDEYYLFMDDVGSLYPNSMINFGYTSRSMKDPDAYKKLVELRLHYKAEAKKANKLVSNELGATWHTDYSVEDEEGNSHLDLDTIKATATEETYKHVLEYEDYDAKQSSLKLIINTCYGAMLSQGNGLMDRLGGRSVCITNQLAMTVLIYMLAEECSSIWFFNSNTDGIGYRIHKSEVEKADRIIKTWCEDITGFTMERTVFKKFIQKDVNNYIGITPDGKFKTKGGYVSLYKGGSFRTNSLSIIHKAIVDYLVKGIDPETTIRECKDVTAFQQIIKTGGSYEGSYHYVNGIRVPIQKVNRVYAVKDPQYGQVVKGKWITEKRRKDKDSGKMISIPVEPPVWQETIISECPLHTGIDNENKLTVADLDLDYYIDIAKKRIDKYINMDPSIQRKINKINKEVVIMATKKDVYTDEQTKEIRGLNIYAKLAIARNNFLEAPVKKSGVNRFAEFKYFELEDIVPVASSIFIRLGLVFIISFDQDLAKGTLVNVDNPEEKIEVTSPMLSLTVVDKDGNIKPPAGMNSIQALGGTETYQRRYLYMACLDIVEADAFDSTNGKADPTTGKAETPVSKPKTNKPATVEERQEVKEELINQGGEATATQIKAIKNGLKKLRDKDEKYETYIGASVKRLKAGITKSEAEDLLIEIGEKVAE